MKQRTRHLILVKNYYYTFLLSFPLRNRKPRSREKNNQIYDIVSFPLRAGLDGSTCHLVSRPDCPCCQVCAVAEAGAACHPENRPCHIGSRLECDPEEKVCKGRTKKPFFGKTVGEFFLSILQ